MITWTKQTEEMFLYLLSIEQDAMQILAFGLTKIQNINVNIGDYSVLLELKIDKENFSREDFSYQFGCFCASSAWCKNKRFKYKDDGFYIFEWDTSVLINEDDPTKFMVMRTEYSVHDDVLFLTLRADG